MATSSRNVNQVDNINGNNNPDDRNAAVANVVNYSSSSTESFHTCESSSIPPSPSRTTTTSDNFQDEEMEDDDGFLPLDQFISDLSSSNSSFVVGQHRQQPLQGEPQSTEENDNDDDIVIPSSVGQNDATQMVSNQAPGGVVPTNATTVSSSSTDSSLFLEQILFFGCGLGSSLGYIATLSSLVYFKMMFGPNSFVDLNLAVYLPLLPVSLAQARWDQYLDQRFQSQRTFLVRGVIGFLLTLLGTIPMIQDGSPNTTIHHYSDNSSSGMPSSALMLLIRDGLLQGIGGAILYGTFNQLASFVTSDNAAANDDSGSLKATVSAGVQSSALFVLVLSTVTGFEGKYGNHFPKFVWSVVIAEVICFLMFLWLLTGRRMVTNSMTRRDSSIRFFQDIEPNRDIEIPGVVPEQQQQQQRSDSPDLWNDDGLHEPLLPSPATSSETGIRNTSGSLIGLSFSSLWKYSQSCCWVLVVTLIPSFLVGSWFTRVESNWMGLAQILFYVRIGADFLGRLATIVVPPKSIRCLSWTSAFRLVPVITFFIHTSTFKPTTFDHYHKVFGVEFRDIVTICLVAIIAFQSGYLVTGCFQLAPEGLPWDLRQTNLAKQASLLTVFFSVSAILGLLASFALIAIGV